MDSIYIESLDKMGRATLAIGDDRVEVSSSHTVNLCTKSSTGSFPISDEVVDALRLFIIQYDQEKEIQHIFDDDENDNEEEYQE